jgi:tetratricopeptide (TPR) repeat protein
MTIRTVPAEPASRLHDRRTEADCADGAGPPAGLATGDLARVLQDTRNALLRAAPGRERTELMRALYNRAVMFSVTEQHEEAIHVMAEAVDWIRQDRLLPLAHQRHMQAGLAVMRHDYADALESRGCGPAARQQRMLAGMDRWHVDLDPGMPGEPDLQDLGALGAWFALKARLGDLAGARRGALRYLSLLRRCGTGQRCRLHALMALAEYHFHSGRPDKGANRLKRVITLLRAAGSSSRAPDASQRLARMYAAAGHYAPALAWARQARAEHATLQGERASLHARLAALEREVVQRRAQRQEALVHRQRLAVVGRLMSDISYALAIPITLAHSTLACCMERASPQAVSVALRRVIDQVDKATSLARQLRMFSYRAAPQARVVDLHESLREAWDGMAPWRCGAVRALRVSGEPGAQVRVDAQRLAVLLRILLIEADQAAPAAPLSARIARGAQCSRMELSCRTVEDADDLCGGPRAAAEAGERSDSGRGGLPSSGADTMADASVGVTLCRQIVQEMGGRLTRAAAAPGRVGFLLELPAH